LTLPKPSNLAAFMSGVWIGVLQLIYANVSMELTDVQNSVAFMVVAFFGLLPAFRFVLGGGAGDEYYPFASVTAFGATLRRGLVWLFGTAAFSTIVYGVVMLFSSAT